MQSLFGLELSTAQKVIVASVVILVLLALLGLFVRQIQGGRLRLRGQVAGRQRQPRLGVVDTYDLDRQRQLVLIRRDNIEHLVMIGGASDVVVETNIMRSGSRSVVPSYADTAMPDRPLPPFETLVPPSEPALRAGDEMRRNGAAEVPDLLPPLPSRAAPQADFTATGASVAAALGVSAPPPAPAPAKPAAPPPPVPPVTTGPAPSFAREHAPPPPVSPGELDDMTRQLEEALKRPFSAVRPANLPDEAPAETAAPAVKPPAPASAPAPVAPPPVAAPRFEPRPAPKVVPAAPHIPVIPPSTPSRQDPFPSNVEAELAAALGLPPEPAAPKAPEPRVAESKAVEQPKVAEPKPVLPKTPEPRAPEFRPAEPKVPEPRPVEPRFAEPRFVEPKPAEPKPVEPKPVPVKAEPQPAPPPQPLVEPRPEPALAAPEPQPPAVEAKPEPKPEPKPQPKPEPEKPAAPPEPKEIDPFSVDAIEAEFARLLGRGPKDKP